jgi:hypothetical protein
MAIIFLKYFFFVDFHDVRPFQEALDDQEEPSNGGHCQT